MIHQITSVTAPPLPYPVLTLSTPKLFKLLFGRIHNSNNDGNNQDQPDKDQCVLLPGLSLVHGG
ncbi:hypothetical protein EON65_43065 [archaeon]|nr:MAG: hypothetical protein EON65_43065 [archaeon]